MCSKLSHKCRASNPKKLLRASLGLSPRGTDLIQQGTTLDCNLYWEAPAVFPIRNLLDPTIDQHDLQIPGQRGWVEVQALPNLDTSNRSEEHTSELQSPCNLVCRLLLEKKKT